MDLALAFQVAKANAEATAPAAPEMPGASSSKSNCLRERDCLRRIADYNIGDSYP